ncbi:MAG: hypothetical protein V3T17_10115, partial [Pseudomonadales bacterium]
VVLKFIVVIKMLTRSLLKKPSTLLLISYFYAAIKTRNIRCINFAFPFMLALLFTAITPAATAEMPFPKEIQTQFKAALQLIDKDEDPTTFDRVEYITQDEHGRYKFDVYFSNGYNIGFLLKPDFNSVTNATIIRGGYSNTCW